MTNKEKATFANHLEIGRELSEETEEQKKLVKDIVSEKKNLEILVLGSVL